MIYCESRFKVSRFPCNSFVGLFSWFGAALIKTKGCIETAGYWRHNEKAGDSRHRKAPQDLQAYHSVEGDALHPTPCTLHRPTFKLHPTLDTEHPTPCAMHPTACTLHPEYHPVQGGEIWWVCTGCPEGTLGLYRGTSVIETHPSP